MSDSSQGSELIRRYHVHYDVSIANAGDGSGAPPEVVLRLWAVHPKGARALPGCENCRLLLADLRSLAGTVFGPGDVAVVEEPFRPALYDSGVVPGADEVALDLRLAPSGTGADAAAAVRRDLRAARARLLSLGIPER